MCRVNEYPIKKKQNIIIVQRHIQLINCKLSSFILFCHIHHPPKSLPTENTVFYCISFQLLHLKIHQKQKENSKETIEPLRLESERSHWSFLYSQTSLKIKRAKCFFYAQQFICCLFLYQRSRTWFGLSFGLFFNRLTKTTRFCYWDWFWFELEGRVYPPETIQQTLYWNRNKKDNRKFSKNHMKDVFS